MNEFALWTSRRLATMVFLFLVVGHILLFSATGVLGVQRYGSEFYFISRQAVVALAGLVLMGALARIPYRLWRRFALPLLLLQLLITAFTLFSGLSVEASGARRWLALGDFRFQPSEFAKITIPLYFCHLLVRHQERGLSLPTWTITSLPVAALLFIIYRQPDLGTTGILCAVMFSTVFLAGLRTRYLLGVLAAGSVFLGIALTTSQYRLRRLTAFLNPWSDPQGSGFQVIQSFLSLHSGGVLGLGIGNGNSKLFHLPEVHTDFIFALVGEELGFVGTSALVLAFLYFSYVLFRAVSRISEPFGSLLAFALTFCLVLQILINLGGVTGLLPVKGLPLPFISWGRSALMANLAMVGILIGIIRQAPMVESLPSGKKA